MSVGGEFIARKEMPAYVRFEKRPVQDLSIKDRYVAKDVDFVLITPPFSKDELIKPVSTWLTDLDQHERDGRLPSEWVAKYKRAYDAWSEGQEIPLDGTPIKGWGVLSPAQQENLIRMNVFTVEMLSGMNDEGIRRYGMGAVDLKNKAVAWLSQVHDKGPLTMENARLTQEVKILQGSVDSLMRQMEAMAQQMKMAMPILPGAGLVIPATAVFDEEPEVRRGPGRPRKDG